MSHIKGRVGLLCRVLRNYPLVDPHPKGKAATTTLVHFFTIPPFKEFEFAVCDSTPNRTDEQLLTEWFPTALLALSRVFNPDTVKYHG